LTLPSAAPVAARCYSHGKVETDEEFDARWVTYFSKPDIDAWELKKGEARSAVQGHVVRNVPFQESGCVNLAVFMFPKGMNTLIGYDLVPEAKILDSALRACRRLDDLASAVRILEAVKVRLLCAWFPFNSFDLEGMCWLGSV